jgi:ATP-dependent Clp protease ATP-binding subunit ClpA
LIMKQFGKYVRTILEHAGREAQVDRSTTIEAQHVLLAIAAQPETGTGQILTSVGLDHRALREALDREFEHSLGAAGVSVRTLDLQRSSSAPAPASNLGSSVRQALERGVAGVRKDPRPTHLLLGILRAEIGTVPRALALAGVDRANLLLRVEQALTAIGG